MEKLKNFKHRMFGDFSVYGTSEKPMFNAGEVALKLWAPTKVTTSGNKLPDMNKLRKALKVSEAAETPPLHKSDFISEKQLYRATIKSNSPSAEDFQDWITDLVLPTIRRTGGFVAENSSLQFIKTYFPSLSETEVLFMSKQLEENRQLQEKLTKSESHVDDLIDNFKAGITLTQAVLQLNGVKQKGLLSHLIAKKKIKMHSKVWVESGDQLFQQVGYLPTGYTRDWFQINFLESDEPVAKTRQGKWFYRRESVLTLTKIGMEKIYRLYKSEKLPMLSSWDGEFKFVK